MFLVNVPSDDKSTKVLVSLLRSLNIGFSYIDSEYDVKDYLIDAGEFITDDQVGSEFSYSSQELSNLSISMKIDYIVGIVEDLMSTIESVAVKGNVITVKLATPVVNPSYYGAENTVAKVHLNDTNDAIDVDLFDDKFHIVDTVYQRLLKL
jgi:hypothetical protein